MVMINRLKTIGSLLLLLITTGLNAQDLSKLFEQLDASVVTIEVVEYKVQNQQLTSSGGLGSGVVISKDGLIMTCLLYTSPSPRDRG